MTSSESPPRSVNLQPYLNAKAIKELFLQSGMQHAKITRANWINREHGFSYTVMGSRIENDVKRGHIVQVDESTTVEHVRRLLLKK